MDTVQKQLPAAKWIPLSYSFSFLMRSKKLLFWSFLLILFTVFVTWIGYTFTVDFVDGLTDSFFLNQPEAVGVWGWTKYSGWLVMEWVFLIVSRVAAFYLAFLTAYTLSAPGYVFLSTAVEKIHEGKHFEADAALTLKGVLIDLLEGVKIGLFGVVVTIAAIAANFIPVVGQVIVLLLYTYYSTLMFVDYPSSRRRWSLGKKMGWIRKNNTPALRLGILPALVSLIPLLNIFFMAMIFPLMTVHMTLNFAAIEQNSRK